MSWFLKWDFESISVYVGNSIYIEFVLQVDIDWGVTCEWFEFYLLIFCNDIARAFVIRIKMKYPLYGCTFYSLIQQVFPKETKIYVCKKVKDEWSVLISNNLLFSKLFYLFIANGH